MICLRCRQINSNKRDQSADLQGKIALVTGGRTKIGYHTALKLLRCGATVCCSIIVFSIDSRRIVHIWAIPQHFASMCHMIWWCDYCDLALIFCLGLYHHQISPDCGRSVCTRERFEQVVVSFEDLRSRFQRYWQRHADRGAIEEGAHSSRHSHQQRGADDSATSHVLFQHGQARRSLGRYVIIHLISHVHIMYISSTYLTYWAHHDLETQYRRLFYVFSYHSNILNRIFIHLELIIYDVMLYDAYDPYDKIFHMIHMIWDVRMIVW